VAPLTGWVRNYHGYQFFDRRDGAAWGPEDSSAIDMMHMAMNGFDYLDDRKTRLAEILQVTLLLLFHHLLFHLLLFNDMMHMAMNGFVYLDDRKTRLAEILQVAFLLQVLLLLLVLEQGACGFGKLQQVWL